MLDERVGKPIQHENCVGRVRKSWKKSLIGIKLSSNTKFPHPTRFSIFSQILRSAKPIQHFIQHGKNAMLDEMLDWFASALNQHIGLVFPEVASCEFCKFECKFFTFITLNPSSRTRLILK